MLYDVLALTQWYFCNFSFFNFIFSIFSIFFIGNKILILKNLKPFLLYWSEAIILELLKSALYFYY